MIINKNWTNEDGAHDGGVSIGEKFTISWQRGPCSVGEVVKNLSMAVAFIDCARGELVSRRDRRRASGTLGTVQGN